MYRNVCLSPPSDFRKVFEFFSKAARRRYKEAEGPPSEASFFNSTIIKVSTL